MILFSEDWAAYPNAIPHVTTKNESFLRLAKVFKSTGVVNHAFHLALHDPVLLHIDPFSESLTQEEMWRVARECEVNPWYAMREVIRLPEQGSPEPIAYRANRANISLTWSYFNHIDYMLIQPRQTGKSRSTDVIWIILMYLMGHNLKIQLFTEKNKLRKENVVYLKAIRDNLPKYLNPTNHLDSDNHEGLTCVVRGNSYLTSVGRPSKEGAESIGRGISSSNFQCDEVPYVPNVDISLPVALASGTNARMAAKRAGAPYGNIFTTTAGNRDTRGGKYAYGILSSSAPWSDKFYDATHLKDLEEIVLKRGTYTVPSINGTFSHRQLGLTDQWCKDAIANARGSVDSAKKDFLNYWFNGTLSSPLATKVLEAIANSERDPSYIEKTRDNYLMDWYIPLSEIDVRMAKHHHLITLDSAQMVGKDSNALIISDIRDMGVVGVCDVNEANLLKYGLWLAELMLRFPKTTLIIESASSAQGLIDIVMVKMYTAGIDPFRRIFNRVVDMAETRPSDFEKLSLSMRKRDEHFYNSLKGYFGFKTNAASRYHLYDTVLQQAARTTAHRVHDSKLSHQIRGLVTKNDRVDHDVGGHDDLVISWLLGHWFITNAKNIEYYGIKRGECLSLVTEDGATLSLKQSAIRDEQVSRRLRLERLKDMLANESRVAHRMQLEHQIKTLARETEIDGGEVVNIDNALTEAREKGKKRVSLRHALRRHL